ncbi:MAG: cysteine desulfurase family protein [Alsobacter sp.]
MTAPTRTYLDHNATSALRPQAREAVLRALEEGGNASSVHAEGRRARGRIEAAREAVAGLAGVAAGRVIFTSGGTEANVLALSPGLAFSDGAATRLLVGATEHACVLQGHRFPAEAVDTVPVLASGLLDCDALAARLRDLAAAGERPLLALQAANNETGVLQPLRAAADLVHAAGGWLHCDAVQVAGKLPLDLAGWGVDSAALSAHKLGGPQGAGALVLADPATTIAGRMLRGGGQERGQRAGTENGPGLAGFGAAAAAALAGLDEERGRIAALRDELEAGLKALAPEAVIFGEGAPRLPNTTLVALPGLPAATALIALDLEGLALSSGAACSSGKVQASHVLAAMGADPDLARGALRISLGWNNSGADVICFLRAFAKVRDTHITRRNRRAA